MFDGLLQYIEVGELVAILISILSLSMAWHALRKDRPDILVEKHTARINQDKKSSTFTFYLNNLGKQPTTIKEITFFTRGRYTPDCTLFRIYKGMRENLASGRTTGSGIVPLSTPFQLVPYSSLVVRALLKFPSVEVFYREHRKQPIHYYVRIKHSAKKPFEKLV